MPTQIGNFAVLRPDETNIHSSITFKPRHLLVGNGFSSALLGNTFSYSSLLQNLNTTNFSIGNSVRNIFTQIRTSDFEEVIRRLYESVPIAREYGVNINSITRDADLLKQELITSIGAIHPEHPFDGITDANYKSAKKFLSRFKSIFTLNYDLLLYWTIIKTGLTSQFKDGFTRIKRDLPLVWNGENQNFFHLHGGLHIYKILWDAHGIESYEEISDFDFIKVDNVDQNNNLVAQIQGRLNQRIYPVTVAEGDAQSKKSKIFEERILRHAYSALKTLSGNLYTFGIGLEKNQDNHLFDALRTSQLSTVYVGVYNPTPQALGDIEAKFRQMNNFRSPKGLNHIALKFYDTGQAQVW